MACLAFGLALPWLRCVAAPCHQFVAGSRTAVAANIIAKYACQKLVSSSHELEVPNFPKEFAVFTSRQKRPVNVLKLAGYHSFLHYSAYWLDSEKGYSF